MAGRILAAPVLRIWRIRIRLLRLGTIAIGSAMLRVLAVFDLRVMTWLILASVVGRICHCNYSSKPALLIARKRNADFY
jgi:hypothetical protein